MADKLNSKDKNKMLSEEEDKNFKFFWEKCMPENIDASPIIEKVRLKIKREKIRRRRFILSSVSIAASVFIFAFAFYFMQQSRVGGSAEISRMIAGMEKVDIKSIKEVTLITSRNRMALNENAFVKYTKAGEITVNSQKMNEATAMARNEYNYLLVPGGKRVRLELADGTVLTVNSQSKVLYPRHFNGKDRKIFIDGEAFMSVAHDKVHPFIVMSEDFNLRVLGTKFNVSTYKGMESVVLVRGSVEVTDNRSHKTKLSPNEMLGFKDGAISNLKKVDVSEYVSWVDGVLVLKGSSLSAVTQKLGTYYGVSVHCSERIADKQIYGKLCLKNDLNKVLQCLQHTIPMKIEKKDMEFFLK